jgi:hypothetical protein
VYFSPTSSFVFPAFGLFLLLRSDTKTGAILISPNWLTPCLPVTLELYVHEMHSRYRVRFLESQRPAIPPHGARIELPSATMSPTEQVVDDVWHKEWHRRKVMHAAFEASVRGTEHDGGDSILKQSQWYDWIWRGVGISRCL